MYRDGKGVTKNYNEAVQWYTKAAEHGNASAQYDLGLMYNEGKGVPRDYKEAAAWFTKAANQGLVEAQNSLGLMYDMGQGVPQNDVCAYKWWNLAAAQGHELAIINRDSALNNLTPTQIAEGQRLSMEFKPLVETEK